MTGLAYERAGPRGSDPVALIHAGIADRRMWDPLWPQLVAERDALRMDLRGFGDTAARPDEPVSEVGDVLALLDAEGIARCHVVGVSFGAGVAVEIALTRPEVVASLLLVAPGGALIAGRTPDLAAFAEAENAALERGDLDAAADANVRTWAAAAGPEAQQLVATMQRRAFELTMDWDDVEWVELDPPALERLGELQMPVTVLNGGADLDAIHAAADALTAGILHARRVDWPDAGHLPPLEAPEDFLALLREHLAGV